MRSSDWISMNYFLSCSPQCPLQYKKKIIEIGLVEWEIIAKYDSFGPYQIQECRNLVWSETIVFCDYLAIYWSDFSDLFFVVMRMTSSIQQKKDRRDRITGSRDNFFQIRIGSGRVRIFGWSDPDPIRKFGTLGLAQVSTIW